MAYPTGSGSERLHRGFIHNQVSTPTAFRFDGGVSATGTGSYTVPANHIVTIVSIIFAEQSNVARTFNLYSNMVSPSAEVKFLSDHPLTAYATFVWSDKIVFHGGDSLLINCSGSSNTDVWYTYIDQNWE